MFKYGSFSPSQERRAGNKLLQLKGRKERKRERRRKRNKKENKKKMKKTSLKKLWNCKRMMMKKKMMMKVKNKCFYEQLVVVGVTLFNHLGKGIC